jgi:hypothetical protein
MINKLLRYLRLWFHTNINIAKSDDFYRESNK